MIVLHNLFFITLSIDDSLALISSKWDNEQFCCMVWIVKDASAYVHCVCVCVEIL